MTNSNTYNGRFVMSAEWDTQSGIQLTWPHQATDWQPMLSEITDTYVKMAVEIAKREQLIIVAPQPEEALRAISEKAGNDITENIITMKCDTDDTWARDHGFITLCGNNGSRILLDFRFNGWGMKFKADKDNAINRKLYDAGIVKGEHKDNLDFVLEGGSIESDGRGTVFTTTGCLMAPNRNQPMSQDEIESELKRRLEADRIVWIDHGNLTGDDTDGHIDTLVRVAPDNTLLYMGCDDNTDEQYDELKKMETQLIMLRTADGKPYRLLRLPSPDAIYDDGERLPATYANYLVINDAVLCPTYGQPENDRKAMEVMAQAFPGREIVGIDCRSIIKQHGSLHCCTMQYY